MDEEQEEEEAEEESGRFEGSPPSSSRGTFSRPFSGTTAESAPLQLASIGGEEGGELSQTTRKQLVLKADNQINSLRSSSRCCCFCD